MNTLIATVGLPRSGKTTFCNTYNEMMNTPIVCPDSIRFALHGHRFSQQAERYVWSIAHTMVDALFLSGHKVVLLDSCNCSKKRRDEWVNSNYYNTIFVEISANVNTCKNRAGDDKSIIPVIDRMHENYDVEGMDNLVKTEKNILDNYIHKVCLNTIEKYNDI